jgi:hypothetical protein
LGLEFINIIVCVINIIIFIITQSIHIKIYNYLWYLGLRFLNIIICVINIIIFSITNKIYKIINKFEKKIIINTEKQL